MSVWRIPMCFLREAADLDGARDEARSMAAEWKNCYGWEIEVGEPEQVKPILDPQSSEFRRGYSEIMDAVSDIGIQDRLRFTQSVTVLNPSNQYEYGKASALNEIMQDVRRALNPAPHIKPNPEGEGW